MLALLRVVLIVPARGLAEWSRKHPSGVSAAVAGRHDHVSGTGLLIHVIERGLVALLMPLGRACPGLGDPPGRGAVVAADSALAAGVLVSVACMLASR